MINYFYSLSKPQGANCSTR